MFIFKCKDATSIGIGTEVISHTGRSGVVTEEEDMRDSDGSYGKGFVVSYYGSTDKSWIALSDIIYNWDDRFAFESN